jgi:hypothetical protein
VVTQISRLTVAKSRAFAPRIPVTTREDPCFIVRAAPRATLGIMTKNILFDAASVSPSDVSPKNVSRCENHLTARLSIDCPQCTHCYRIDAMPRFDVMGHLRTHAPHNRRDLTVTFLLFQRPGIDVSVCRSSRKSPPAMCWTRLSGAVSAATGHSATPTFARVRRAIWLRSEPGHDGSPRKAHHRSS